MALDLGTLVAYLDVDNSKLNRGATDAEVRLEEVSRDRKTTIEVDADTGTAEAELDAVARDRSSTINANTKGLSGLLTTAAALGPALIPVAAAVAGLAGALSAPLAAAGGGLTVFGLIAGTAVAKTEKVKKQIDELRQKAATLVDPKAAKKAAAQADALEKSLTGPQRMFLAAQDSLAGAFQRLVKRAGPAVFSPLISAMHMLADILPRLQPLLRVVSHALGDVFDRIGKAVQGGGFDKFLSFFVKFSGPAIKGFVKIMAGIGKGVMGLVTAFAPVSTKIMGGLEGMAKSFGKFGANAGHNGFQKFIAYVQKVGPAVVATIGSLVGAVAHFVQAIAPLGSVALGAIKGIADGIKSMPLGLLTEVAAAFVAITLSLKTASLAMKGYEAIMALVKGAQIVYIAMTEGMTAAQVAFDAAADANPIGAIVLALTALVAGLVYAYKHFAWFHAAVDATFHAIGAAVGWVVGFVKAHWALLLPILLGPFGLLVVLVVKHFDTIKSAVTTAFHAIGAVAKWLWNNVFQPVIHLIVEGFAVLMDKIGDFLGALSHIPGFGWAKTAADAMHNAADKARELADNINKIHDKNVTLTLTTVHSVVTKNATADQFGNRSPGGPHRAAGGPVMGGATYMVGENGPELFTPGMPGSITSTHNLRTASGGGNGAAVFNLYDADGALIGRMRGEAHAVVNGQHGYHRTLERMNA